MGIIFGPFSMEMSNRVTFSKDDFITFFCLLLDVLQSLIVSRDVVGEGKFNNRTQKRVESIRRGTQRTFIEGQC